MSNAEFAQQLLEFADHLVQTRKHHDDAEFIREAARRLCAPAPSAGER
jgi:Arc/MetJ-type ribon-helix-helix transcriptional regulator